MRRWPYRGGVLLIAFAAFGWAALAACAADPADGGFDSVDASPADGGRDGGLADGDLTTPSISFRLVHLSPDVGRIDVCYRSSPSEAFTGPLLLSVPPAPDAGEDAADTGASDASSALDGGGGADGGDARDAGEDADASATEPPGLSFPGATGYFSIPSAGSLEIAVVRADDGNCGTPRVRQRMTFDSGGHTTIALLGLALADAGSAQAIGLVPFVDDATPAAGTTRTRFVHAALGAGKSAGPLALSVEATSQSSVIRLAARVEPGRASTASGVPPTIDALGYHDGEPVSGGSLHLAEVAGAPNAQAVSWLSGSSPLELPAGTTHTGFVVSESGPTLGVLLCDDGAADSTCLILRR